MVNLELKARERLGKQQIKEASKIVSQKQRFEHQLESRRLSAQTKSFKQNISSLKRLTPAPFLSQEQSMLRDMFAGDELWGTGDSLPVINHSLNSGRGIINSGDDSKSTASLFGL